jgi:hypothetical protein
MTVLTPVSEGVVYYVRVHPATSTYTDSGTVTWAGSVRVPPLLVQVLADVLTTPAWLKVTVSNGTPLDPVEFRIDGGATIFSAVLDDNGQIVGISIPLPSLSAGTHTITAATPTLSGTVSFAVTNPPVAYPVGLAADSPPVLVAQTGVVRWVLQDPTSGGQSFVFPISPSKMFPPHAARVFTSEHSTAPDGQPLTFEGAPVGVDWAIEGTCRTQGFHDTLETFLAMPRRVYLIDHLSRAWTVTLESIAWTRLAEAYNDWAYTYQLKAIIYAGPVDLS